MTIDLLSLTMKVRCNFSICTSKIVIETDDSVLTKYKYYEGKNIMATHCKPLCFGTVFQYDVGIESANK